jgi:hypothetical protein
MKVRTFSFVVWGILLGCGSRDPIDRLMARLQTETKSITFTSYPFSPIDLPATASSEQLISALSERGDFQKLHVTKVRIVLTRTVQTPEDIPPRWHHTAVLLESDAGQKIVLLRPLHSGWYFKIYDAP